MESKNDVSQFCLNLRWLARAKEVDPLKWAEKIASTTRFMDKKRATGLLMGAKPTDKEVEVVADAFGQELESLITAPLYGSGTTLRTQNLRCLVEALPKGQGQVAAKEIGITAPQLSRWGTKVLNPREEHVRKLLKFHGMDQDIDLQDVPIFLSLEPISGFGRKSWMIDRLREMPADEAAELYPAMKKLFRRDAKD